MTLSDVAIRRPVFTTMVSASLLVLGALGYLRLGTDLWPSASIPFCTVTTVYPGAGPQTIEGQVTQPLEEAVAGIPGIDRVFSQSRENVSIVFVQFKLSVPFSEAVQQVRDKVGIAMGHLPRGIDPPAVAQFDISALPIMVFAASSSKDDVLTLSETLDDAVRPQLEQIEGVADARVVGGTHREVAVDLMPERLAAMHIPAMAIFDKIRAEHLDLPAGRYSEGTQEIGVRVQGEFSDVEGLRKMIVAANPDGRIVRLSDVANVHEVPTEARTIVRSQGREALAVEVVKQSGANTVKVAKAVQEELQSLQQRLGPSFIADVIVDQSRDINANTNELWIAIGFGGLMAVLVILFFLVDVRGTIISALALPTSVIGTLFVMWILGFTLNQVTLLSLSLAIGLLIDDAVVVRESITRRLQAGEDPMRAASNGTREIALAVMATTFTLCAVFLPVAFMQGLVAQFFRQFGLTITAAVLISLFIAFTLDPMLSSRFTKAHVPREQRNALARGIEDSLDGLDRLYGRSLGWVLQHRVKTFLAALAVLAGTLYWGSRLGVEFLGSQDRGQLTVAMEFPPGTRLDVTAARSAVAEAEVMKLPGMRNIYAVLGPDAAVEKVRWRVLMTDKEQRSQTLSFYKEKLRLILGNVPDAKFEVSEPPLLEGVGDWPPIWVQVTGPDFKVLRQEAAFVAETLRGIVGTVDVRVADNPGRPEMSVQINREAAAAADLVGAQIATQVRLASQGEVAGKLHQGRREQEIRVRLNEAGRNSAQAVQNMLIWGQKGPVPLSKVTLDKTVEGPSVIEHEMRERQISITAQIGAGNNLGAVSTALRDALEQHPLPHGYNYWYKGQQKDLKDMLASTQVALILALIFVFMVLASQFESLLHPLTIMLALPLGLIGAIWALGLTGNPLSLGAAIGLILLMGLVTKNAILLVDNALEHVRAGESPVHGMLAAGPRRLRPILMTSAAMILGMVPTAIGKGAGSEFHAPMAMAVIGGVLSSTLLTLWVVPVVFVWFERLRGHKPQPGGTVVSYSDRRARPASRSPL